MCQFLCGNMITSNFISEYVLWPLRVWSTGKVCLIGNPALTQEKSFWTHGGKCRCWCSNWKHLEKVRGGSRPLGDLSRTAVGLFHSSSFHVIAGNTRVINNINNECIPFRCASSMALVLCMAGSLAWFNETVRRNVTIVDVIHYTCAFTARTCQNACCEKHSTVCCMQMTCVMWILNWGCGD